MFEVRNVESNVAEVLQQLKVDGNNKILKTIDNFRIILEKDNRIKNIIRFNELSESAECSTTNQNWQEVNDSVLRCYIEQQYGIRSNECYFDAFNIICHFNTYNPIKKLIEAHEWDGIPRIKTFLQTYLGCEDTPYTSEVARLIFTGGIARLYNPGCKFDFMPIFQGKQGAGKSSIIRWLALNDSWFKEIGDIDGQQGKEAVEGAWICEISELLALTKAKEVEAVKSFITRQNDGYRKPYERRVTDNPRKCIFLGTTNKSQFLTDKTGNRRFLPIKVNVNGYDLFDKEQEVKAAILQCWEEAKYYFDKGEYSMVLDRSVLAEAETVQTNVVEDDYRVGIIRKYLDDVEKTCVIDIWRHALNQDKEPTKKDSNDIVSIFDNEFLDSWEKVKSIRFGEYGIQKGWRKKVIKKPDEPTINTANKNANADALANIDNSKVRSVEESETVSLTEDEDVQQLPF